MTSCRVCASVHRKAVDAALASADLASPRKVAGMFKTLSRQQVRRHRDWCLGGVPRIMFGLLHAGQTEEDVARQLAEEGKPREAIEFTLATVRRLLEEPEAGTGGGGR